MGLLSTLEGKRGEELCSATLAYLFNNSDSFASSFLGILAEISNCDILDTKNRSCRLEHTTYAADENASEVRGRLDLLIETISTVIGIEVKFNALFQDDQPRKYLESLRRLSAQRDYFLVVLAPKSRAKEIQVHLSSATHDDRCFFLSWEKSIASLQGSPRRDAFSLILNELESFIRLYVDFPRDLAEKIYLLGEWEERGTYRQHTLLNRLWTAIPEALRANYRRVTNPKYVGYYLYPIHEPKDREVWIWLGFVDAQWIKDNVPKTPACFMVGLSGDVAVPDTISCLEGNRTFTRLQEVSDWTEYEHHCWMVHFKDDWNTLARWEQELAPFLSSLADLEEFQA